jgi:diguanylate cyclase (GGDEF)-like protein
VVSRALGTSDLAGRLGGEEFAVLLAGRDTNEALLIAQRIRIAFRNGAQFVDGLPLKATVSVGVANWPRQVADPAEMIAGADRALYSAKSQGRDCVVVASDLSDSNASNVVQIAARR